MPTLSQGMGGIFREVTTTLAEGRALDPSTPEIPKSWEHIVEAFQGIMRFHIFFPQLDIQSCVGVEAPRFSSAVAIL